MKIRMARTSGGLMGATYFHGSAHEFEAGAVLTPESGDQDGEYVYLADSARVASLYAQLAASRMHGVPIPNDLGGVYEVEPLGSVEDDPVQEWGGEHRTSGNVRVLRKVDPASTHTAGPAGNMVPFERFPILAPQRFGPKDVKVLRMAEQDIKRLHPGQQAKVREAIEALKAGTAQVEAKERHPLVGSYTVRVTNSLRLGLYLTEDQPGGDPAPDWVVYWVGDHNYAEAERRMQMNPGVRTAAGVMRYVHEPSRSEYGGIVVTDPRMVAYDGEREVGSLDWDARDPRIFGTVRVDPAYRGRGIATRLFEEAKKVNPDLDPETSVFFTPAGRGWVDSLTKTAEAERRMWNNPGVRTASYFHGSDREFEPGDLILPQAETGAPNWAEQLGHTGPLGPHYNPDQVYLSDTNYDAGVFGNYVYEVEPEGEIEIDPESAHLMPGYQGQPVWSRAPRARVVRKVIGSLEHTAALTLDSDWAPGGEQVKWKARADDGKVAGYVLFRDVWDDDLGSVAVIDIIETNPAYARQGVATFLYGELTATYEGVKHTGEFTPEGAAWWAKVTGEHVVPNSRSDQDRGRDWTHASRTASAYGQGGTIYRGLRASFSSDVDAKILDLLSIETDEESYERWGPHGGKQVQAGEIIVRALEESHWDPGVGLGRHWTERWEMARIGAQQGGAGDWGIILTATYRPEDVDPDSDPSRPFMEAESEVTLRPGAEITITDVQVRWYQKFESVFYKPMQARASLEHTAAFDYDHARKTYDQVRSIAKKYTLWDFEGEARDLLRRVLTEAGFPRGEHAEVKVLVGRPDLHGVVAWDLNEGLGTNPLVMMSMKSANEFVLLHEAAHILRNGPSAIGRVGADVDDAHDQRWWDTFTRLIGMYATPLLANAFRHLVLKDVDPSLLRAASADLAATASALVETISVDRAMSMWSAEYDSPVYGVEADLRQADAQGGKPDRLDEMADAVYSDWDPHPVDVLMPPPGEEADGDTLIDGHHRVWAVFLGERKSIRARVHPCVMEDGVPTWPTYYEGTVNLFASLGPKVGSSYRSTASDMVWDVVVMPPGVRHDTGGTVYVDKPGLGGDFQFRFPYREDAVGLLRWYPDGEISDVWVHPDYRRQGLATEMLRRAREADPYVDIHHSEALTSDGQEWSRRVAAFGDGRHTAADLMVRQDVYYRVHHLQRAFSLDDAWSAPLTISFDDHLDEPRRGYSACYTPWDLWAYVVLQSWVDRTSRDEILIFSGEEVGDGIDGEPLIEPDFRTVKWLSWRDFLWALSRMTGRIPEQIRGPLGSMPTFLVAQKALEQDRNDPVAQRLMVDMFPAEDRQVAAPGYGMLPIAASLDITHRHTAALDEVWPVTDILPLRMNDGRKVLNPDQVAKYVADIRAGLTLAPLFIERGPGGDFLSDGHHRLEAAERAGLTEVPVRVFDDRWEALKALNEVERAKTGSLHAAAQPAHLLEAEWDVIMAQPRSQVRDLQDLARRILTERGYGWAADEVEVHGDAGLMAGGQTGVNPLKRDHLIPEILLSPMALNTVGLLHEVAHVLSVGYPWTPGGDPTGGHDGSWRSIYASLLREYGPGSAEPLRAALGSRRSSVSSLEGLDLRFNDSEPDLHKVTAHEGGVEVGSLWWWTSSGEVFYVHVSPSHQRKGIATGLWRWVVANKEPRLHHSSDLTEEGRAWSQTVASAPERPARMVQTYPAAHGGKYHARRDPIAEVARCRSTILLDVAAMPTMADPNSKNHPIICPRCMAAIAKDWQRSSTRIAYQGGHRAPSGADDVGAPLHDVEEMMPDYYEHPEWYSHDRGPVDAETSRVIRGAKGQPDKMITIYRALPPGFTTINDGDWVTISRTYALGHAMQSDDPSEDWPVITAEVPARTLWTEGYAAEWGYDGSPVSARLASMEHTTASWYPQGRERVLGFDWDAEKFVSEVQAQTHHRWTMRHVKDTLTGLEAIEVRRGTDPNRGTEAGFLTWKDGVIDHVEVHNMRRSGLATLMLEFAREISPGLRHSDVLLPDGRAWMEAVGTKRTAVSSWKRTPGGQSYRTSIVGKNGTTYYITGSFESFSAFAENFSERLREYVKVPVGRMHLWNLPGHWEIHQVQVNADHRRQGVASAMLDLAREFHPDVVHSGPGALTDDGAAWAGAYASLRTASAEREIVVSAEGHLWTWRCSVCGEGPPNRGYRDKAYAHEMGYTHAQWCWDLGWDDVPRVVTASGLMEAVGAKRPIRGNLPGYQFVYEDDWSPLIGVGFEGIAAVTREGYAGHLSWDYTADGDPYIAEVWVEEGHRRKGVATELLRLAREIEPTLAHSADLSDMGRSWMQAVGANGLTFEHLRGVNTQDGELVPVDYPNTDALVAREGGKDVGFILWYAGGGLSGSVDMVWVDESHRRKGLATELLRRSREIQPDIDPTRTPWFSDEGEAWVNSLPGVYVSSTTSTLGNEGREAVG